MRPASLCIDQSGIREKEKGNQVSVSFIVGTFSPSDKRENSSRQFSLYRGETDRRTDLFCLVLCACLSLVLSIKAQKRVAAAAAAAAAVFFYLLAFLDGIERREWMGRTDAAHNNVAVISFLSQLAGCHFTSSSSICPSCLNCRSPSRAETQPNTQKSSRLELFCCCCQRIPVSQPSGEKDGKRWIDVHSARCLFAQIFLFLCDKKKKMFRLDYPSLDFVLFPFGRFF